MQKRKSRTGRFLSVLMMLLLAASLLFGAAACNGNPGSSSSSDSSGSSSSGQDSSGDGTIADATFEDAYVPDERPDYGFDYDYDYEIPDPPLREEEEIPEEDPAYTSGGATKITRMEAENADINLQGTNSDAWKNEFNEVNNLAFDFRLSNKLCTRNLNDAWTNGANINFTFTSDKTYMVKARANLSAHDGKTNPYVLANNFKIRSTGTNAQGDTVYSTVDLTDKTIDYPNADILVGGYTDSAGNAVGEANETYFHFAVIEFEVAIYAGETTITFDFSSNGKGCNLDYLELETSANITGWDDTHYEDEGTMWSITQIPTDTEPGIFTAMKYIQGSTRSYKYALPALQTDGKLTAGYTDEGNNTYSFDFKGESYSFTKGGELKAEHSIHQDSLLKFAGGATKITKEAGAVLQDSDFETHSKAITNINVYDTSGNFIGVAKIGSWQFPSYPVVLEVSQMSLPMGYNIYDCGNEQGSRKPQMHGDLKDTALQAEFSRTAALSTEIGGSEAGDELMGSILSYDGTGSDPGKHTLQAGLQFRLATRMGTGAVKLGVEHSFIYNLENFGENEIHLRVNQVNASNTVEAGDEGVEIVLRPGESIRIQIDISFAVGNANNNALTLFTVVEDITDMKLGIAMAAKLGE